MSHKVRAVVGPALSITAIVAVLLAIDDRLLNRSTRLIEDIFIGRGQADGCCSSSSGPASFWFC